MPTHGALNVASDHTVLIALSSQDVAAEFHDMVPKGQRTAVIHHYRQLSPNRPWGPIELRC
jgi:hypothetical protein